MTLSQSFQIRFKESLSGRQIHSLQNRRNRNRDTIGIAKSSSHVLKILTTERSWVRFPTEETNVFMQHSSGTNQDTTILDMKMDMALLHVL